MVEQIRKDLDKVTGELIESFIAFDKKQALHFQIGLSAIYDAQEKKGNNFTNNLYSIRDIEKLEHLLEENNISKHDFHKISDLLDNYESTTSLSSVNLPESLSIALNKTLNKEHSPYSVPNLGMIAVNLNLIKPQVKDALIAGQAGERTLQAIEKSSSRYSANKNDFLKDRLYAYGSNERTARSFIDSELGISPDYVVAAKALNHLADLFEVGVNMISGENHDEDAIEKTINSLKILTIRTLNHSSSQLGEAGSQEAAEKIKKLADHISKDISADADHNHIYDGLNYLKSALKSKEFLTQKEYDDMNILIENRLKQIKPIGEMA
ncbi:hypothetical protein N9W34_06395 [Rickettsiales bacterium]|nr:hypothetical protein [Rickettsiales bacterium]